MTDLNRRCRRPFPHDTINGHTMTHTPSSSPPPSYPSVLERPSRVLEGLVWVAEQHTEGEEPIWHARWNSGRYDKPVELHTAVTDAAWTTALRFEAWLAFTLGLDGFVPVLDPSDHAETLQRGPVVPGTTEPDGVPFASVVPPYDGPYGLEGYILHEASGHVLRAYTEGLPAAGYDLPVLVPMTGSPAYAAEKAQGTTPSATA